MRYYLTLDLDEAFVDDDTGLRLESAMEVGTAFLARYHPVVKIHPTFKDLELAEGGFDYYGFDPDARLTYGVWYGFVARMMGHAGGAKGFVRMYPEQADQPLDAFVGPEGWTLRMQLAAKQQGQAGLGPT